MTMVGDLGQYWKETICIKRNLFPDSRKTKVGMEYLDSIVMGSLVYQESQWK